MLDIIASIIRRSAVGPVSYVINAADLNTLISSNYIYKYADDTYIVIPANAQSRAAELNHVAQWAHMNNLQLNRAKSTEIIFSNSRHKRSGCHPPELPDLKRVTTITILGVTITNHFSISELSEHVTGVIIKCTQSLHALKILRSQCHGMSDEALTVIYKAVVIAKVLHAIPAWRGFTAASDRRKLDAFTRHGVRLKFYSHEDPTMAELADELDETLFTTVLNNDDHLLRYILPDRRNNTYSLRPISLTNLRWQLSAILGTFLCKDFYLKTRINNF